MTHHSRVATPAASLVVGLVAIPDLVMMSVRIVVMTRFDLLGLGVVDDLQSLCVSWASSGNRRVDVMGHFEKMENRAGFCWME